MKWPTFRMHENSLFAVLLRSPWWVSFAVAGGVFAATRYFLALIYAVFSTIPFAAIAAYAGWKALRSPSAAAVAAKLEALRALDPAAFTAALEAALRREGYEVAPLAVAGADLELARNGRISLLAYKRWKVVRTGVEPLRQLNEARRAREAQEAIFIAVGEITTNARSFAAQNGIRLVEGSELAGRVVI